MLFLVVGEGQQINSRTVDVAAKRNQIQQAGSNHKDKERVWVLAQEWLILGELATPVASKSITYGVPFSQLPQREQGKCYLALAGASKQPDRYAE